MRETNGIACLFRSQPIKLNIYDLLFIVYISHWLGINRVAAM